MPSFCKMLIHEHQFTDKLEIPPEFVNNYGEIFTQSSKMVTLKIDDESEKMWRVGTKEIGGLQFLSKGWTKFAQDIDLECPSFMIFKLVDNSTFHVSVYNATACIKDYSYYEEDDDEQKSGEMGSNAERRWRFSQELKHHHFKTQRMLIPKAFAVGTGITTNRDVKLQDGKGREWAVRVTPVWRNDGYSITRGLKSFLVGNNAVIGSIVSFEFIGGSDNLVRALVKNNGIPEDDEKSM